MSAQISVSERKFIERSIDLDCRVDGRSRLDYRPFEIDVGVVPQANGSAHIKLGPTQVLVGVRVEIGEPDAKKPDQGRVFCSVDWCGSSDGWIQLHTLAGSTGNSKEAAEVKHVQGVVSASLEQRLKRCLVPEIPEKATAFHSTSKGLNLESLVLVAGSRCWNVMVDCLILSAGGNVFDAISIAARAALQNTTIPKVKIIAGEDDGEVELELSDDPMDCEKLEGAEHVPLCVTLTKVGSKNYYIVDPTPEEEQCSTLQLTVAVNDLGSVCGVSKTGVNGLEPMSLIQMIKDAQKIGELLIAEQDNLLNEKGPIQRFTLFQ